MRDFEFEAISIRAQKTDPEIFKSVQICEIWSPIKKKFFFAWKTQSSSLDFKEFSVTPLEFEISNLVCSSMESGDSCILTGDFYAI